MIENQLYPKILRKINLVGFIALLVVHFVAMTSVEKYTFVCLCISLLLVVGGFYYLFKKETMLMYTHPKYLFHLSLPKSIYVMNNIDFGSYRIDNLLFHHKGLCIIDSFELEGIIKGNPTQHLLEFHEVQKQYSRKIKNPIKTVRFKSDCFKQIMKLYHINLKIQSILYFPSTIWEEEKITLKDEILIYGVEKLEHWVKGYRRYKGKAVKKRQMMDVLYVLMSIRYYEYLRSFYEQLSSYEKIKLKQQLSAHSLILFDFILLKDAFKLERLSEFIQKNQKLLQQGMKGWQEQLFFELDKLLISNEEADFMPFNLVGLMLSEGFFIHKDLNFFCSD